MLIWYQSSTYLSLFDKLYVKKYFKILKINNDIQSLLLQKSEFDKKPEKFLKPKMQVKGNIYDYDYKLSEGTLINLTFIIKSSEANL